MRIANRGLIPVAVASLILSGCIDDKYDLDDIDTTVRVQVKDLVVPVNIDKATLSNIFDLKEDSKIKIENGTYAFVDKGSFNSDEITIRRVHLTAPDIKPTTSPVHLPASSWNIPAGQTVKIDLAGVSKTSFSAETRDVSDFIVSIERANTVLHMTIGLRADGLQGRVRNIHARNLVLRFPKGLKLSNTSGSYNPSTGLFNVGNVDGAGNSLAISFDVDEVDAVAAGISYSYENSYLRFDGPLEIVSGELVFNSSDLAVSASQLPSSFNLVTTYTMSDIDITSFTGTMRYDLDGFNVSDVTLSDLPDVLTQDGTDISIANPQIYFSVTNPLSSYSLHAQTGMEITSWKGDTRVGTYALDAPGYFTVGGNNVENYYYLSPKTVTTLYPGYPSATHIGYASLSDVLSGNGIPSRLSVDFVNPVVPTQHVTDLKLGVNLGRVNGNYSFYAPLAFGGGSTIVYRDVVDGWSSEDLDHVTIETLSVSAVVDTDFPVPLTFTGYPIDVDGNQINGVEIVGADVPAHAKGQPIEIKITGPVTRLDGIRFVASVKASADTEALSPDMNISLTNIRPRVSGYYEKEL